MLDSISCTVTTTLRAIHESQRCGVEPDPGKKIHGPPSRDFPDGAWGFVFFAP
jgi:hypothetical protein